MKKNIFMILALLIATSFSVNAEYRIYDNKTDFENDKGAICEAATDGCNNYFMSDGKVMGGTRKFCGADFKAEWNCTKYIDNVETTESTTINTLSVPITTTSIDYTTTSNNTNVAFCTMEYAPVCGVDGKTYGNKCSAETGAKVEIAYEGECSVSKLSENDLNLYNSIKKKLNIKYRSLVLNVVEAYKTKIESYSVSLKENVNDKIIDKIDTKISALLMQYPQDKALPENINNIYLTYKLLKFELMKLEF